MSSQLDQIFERAQYYPDDSRLMPELTRIYVSPQTTPEERARIRTFVARHPAMITMAHKWVSTLPTDDPHRFMRLQLVVHAITDGQPDTYEAGLDIERLIKWAFRHGIDVTPDVEAVIRISSPTLVTILNQRMLAWNRTCRFVDQQITSLLETLSRSSNDAASLEALVTMYVHPNTTEDQRRRMRALVQVRPLLVEYYNRWEPAQIGDQPERFYRLVLGSVSMTDAQPDPQYAVQRVSQLLSAMRQHGVDLDAALDDVCAISSPRVVQVLRSARG